ncbi:hypothetical protein MSIMFI_00869 [Mycobacterium simulans]|nr:hypothetical protein MSIMFI_00869 [Mycobacterium simulans]
MPPRSAQTVSQIPQINLGMLTQVPHQPRRRGRHRCSCAPRDGPYPHQRSPRPRRGHGRPRHRRHRRRRGLTHNQMRVGAAYPERGHPRQQRPLRHGPRPGRRDDLHPRLRTQHLKWGTTIQTARQLPVRHCQSHLDQPDHACSGLQMPHIGLHRPNQQRLITLMPTTKHRHQRLGLGAITHRRPRAMRLDVLHLIGPHSRTSQRRLQQPLMALRRRRGQPRPRPLIDHRPIKNLAIDPIAIRQRIGNPFQDNKTPTLPAHISIRRPIKWTTHPVSRQHSQLRDRNPRIRVQVQVHPTGNRHRTVTPAQTVHRQRDCRQR